MDNSIISSPSISVVMPIYNGERYIQDTIKCVLNQTFKSFELICIDDCSSDNSFKIIKKYQNYDDRIVLLRNESRQGAAKSRNLGIEHSRGDYLSFLDADDLFSERMLEKSYELVKKNDLDVIEFGYRIIDENGNLIDTVQRSSYVEKGRIFSANSFNLYQFQSIGTNVWSKLIKRSFVIDYKLEFQDLESANDVFFSLTSVCLAKRLMFIDDEDAEVRYRNHGSIQRITNNRDPLNDYCAYIHIIERLLIEEKVYELELVYGLFLSD